MCSINHLTQKSKEQFGRLCGVYLRCMTISRRFFGFGLLVLLIVAAMGWYFARSDFHSPIADEKLAAVDFPVYYPWPLPDGYRYKNASESIHAGSFFYQLEKGSSHIVISQQARPKENIMVDSIVGLSPISTSLGTAYVGQSGASPVAILTTDSTLVTISGDPQIASNVVNTAVLNLRRIH